ncbi:MAG: DUF6029 family protein [Candidatus Cryptobacteroides sp.]
MKSENRLLTLLSAGLLCWISSSAQTGISNGQFSASLESNSIVYMDDPVLGAHPKEDHFGSNDYLKMDYSTGNFLAGIQLEGYLPALYGFEIGLQEDYKKFFLASKYVHWQKDGLSVHIGDIYDQFGTGLIFRSYEDRNLGFNNSLEGIQAGYSLGRILSLRAMMGHPRYYTQYLDTWVRGADLQFSLSELLNFDRLNLELEAGYVNRYEESFLPGAEPNVHLYSACLNLSFQGLNLKAEYAAKTKDIPAALQNAHTGASILIEGVYNRKNFSLSADFRILDHMGTMLSTEVSGTANVLNYLPSLSRQYHYMLANLNPHQVDVVGEAAGQLDIFYKLKSKEKRHRYYSLHINSSGASTIAPSQTDDGSTRLTWLDINADLLCNWSKAFKTTFLYSRQEWSPSHAYQEGTYVSNIFVMEASYKIDRKYALRGEIQYLNSQDYEKDWVAALLEFSIAPSLNIFVSDMYNSGYSKVHYYNAGISLSKNRSRLQLSYGRNRAGYVCSGGVCRYSPAYTGLNLLLTTSF